MDRLNLASLAGAVCLAVIGAAQAQEAAPAPAAPPAPPPAFKISGHVEGGIDANFQGAANNINFGQTATDRNSIIRMNQAMLTGERDLDPNATSYDFGFKLQGMYGTDARYTHFFNEFDRVTHSPYQWDIIEANVQAHLPWLTAGGIDAKAGQYSTPLGFEVIDATGNPLYSHSYIFSYGLPYKHTGLLTTTHVNGTLDIWAGIDTGVNDSLPKNGMNNREFPKGIFGFGLNNLMGGNLTILALAHYGPENPIGSVNGLGVPIDANSHNRSIFDTVVTYKINPALTSVTEFNRIHDDYYKATAGGVAQYLTYQVNDQVSVTGRAEIFADQGGFNGFGGFVCAAPGSLDAIDGERDLQPNTGYCGNTGNVVPAGYSNAGTPVAYNLTYGALTFGVNYKPVLNLPYGTTLTLRPEIRVDDVIGGSKWKPYNVNASGVGTSSSQVTAAMDAILAF